MIKLSLSQTHLKIGTILTILQTRGVIPETAFGTNAGQIFLFSRLEGGFA